MAGSGPSLCQELGAKHSGQPKTGSEPSRGSGLPWLPPALTSVLGLLLVSQNASKSADASNSAEFLCEKQLLCKSEKHLRLDFCARQGKDPL